MALLVGRVIPGISLRSVRIRPLTTGLTGEAPVRRGAWKADGHRSCAVAPLSDPEPR